MFTLTLPERPEKRKREGEGGDGTERRLGELDEIMRVAPSPLCVTRVYQEKERRSRSIEVEGTGYSSSYYSFSSREEKRENE